MIYILNISEAYGYTYGEGKQVYELGINKVPYCTFEHNFEDGLSTCLRKAADAFDKSEGANYAKVYDTLYGEE